MDKRIPKAMTQSMLFIPACPFRTYNAAGQIKHAYKTVEKNAVLTGAGQTISDFREGEDQYGLYW